MKKSNTLIFFGTEDFSTPALVKLIASDYNVQAVVTKPDAKIGRGQQIKSPKVKENATKADIRIFQPKKLADIKSELKKLEPRYGILVAYGELIPQEVLGIFPGGIINIHPSLLPRYRGPSPLEAVILNADKLTGISIMQLSVAMDEGPIYAQKAVQVPKDIDKPLFSSYLAQVGAEFLLQKLPSILNGSLVPIPQDNRQAIYTKLLKKEDGWIDWTKSAERYEREVRAYLGWPKSRAKVLGRDIIITKAQVAKDKDDGELVMKCSPGWLEIIELVAPSGRTMSGADFLRGYKPK